MCGLAEQGLVNMLAVQVDKVVADLRELLNRRHAAVHIGARAPGGGNRPREDDFGSLGHETTFDYRLRGARAHDGGVRPAAEQQLEGLDDKRLAGAGLAGERRHARADHELQIRDDTQVPHS